MTSSAPVAPEAISDFLASPPPRAIPPALRRARLPRGPLVFAVTIAAVVLLATGPLVARLFPDRLMADLRLDRIDPAVAQAEVLAIEPTGLERLRGPRHEPKSIDRIRFRFDSGLDAGSVAGASHAAGHGLRPGDRAAVEFDPNRPRLARIADTTLSRTPRLGAAVLLFPLVAAGWLTWVVKRRRHVHQLLRDGAFTFATIRNLDTDHVRLTPIRRDQVSVRLTGGPHDGLELDFAPGPREQAALRTHRPGDRIGLLIHPRRPTSRPVLAETLIPAAQLHGDHSGDDT